MFRRYRFVPDNGTNPAVGNPPAGNPTDPQPQAGDPQPTPQAGGGKTPEDYERIIADLRKENAGHRTKLKKFEDDETQRTQAQMTETERLQKQLSELQTQYDNTMRQMQEDRNYTALERAGRSLGVSDPTALEDAVKLALIDLALDESDEEPDFENAMKNILKSRPWLTRGATLSSGGATNPARSQTGQFSQITRDNLTEAMQQYDKLPPSQKAEVTRLLTNR